MSAAALIGLGEVGRVFAEDLLAAGVADVRAWDVALGTDGSRAAGNAAALSGRGVRVASSAADAVAGAALVVSAVTAANSVAAARIAVPALAPGAWFLDLNSSSPAHKVAAAAAVEETGGRYVEAALMSPIGPRRLGSPFLLGGPHAADFVAEAPRWGLTATRAASETVGRAAATKLCRSVIVKGLEALLTESLLAARQYGVEREVLDSLPNILPPGDWSRIAGYFISRSVEHGERRSEEMAEAAATVADVGVVAWMAEATVERQRWAARFRDAVAADGTASGPDGTDAVALIDALLRAGAAGPGPDARDGHGEVRS